MNDLILPQASLHPFIDTTNPQHFINLLPTRIRELVLEIPLEYFQLTDKQLLIRAFHGEPPEETAAILRLNFWEEYNRCFMRKYKMKLVNIVDGVLSSDHTALYGYLANNPARFKFIITEPTTQKNKIRHAYQMSLESIIDILNMKVPINLKTGTPDAGILKLKAQIFEYLDQRIHPQETPKQVINVNNINTNQAAAIPSPNEPSVQDRIKQIQDELAGHNILPPAIDVPNLLMDQHKEEAGRITEEFRTKPLRNDG